jgi:phage gp36-like protein
MYCTIEDIRRYVSEERLTELTDDTSTGTVDIAIVDGIITDAADEVNSYLQARYTVPLASVPRFISQLTIDIAIYRLYKRRFAMEMPESLDRSYQSALKNLRLIQKGDVSIGAVVSEGEQSPAAPAMNVLTNKRRREFRDI